MNYTQTMNGKGEGELQIRNSSMEEAHEGMIEGQTGASVCGPIFPMVGTLIRWSWVEVETGPQVKLYWTTTPTTPNRLPHCFHATVTEYNN